MNIGMVQNTYSSITNGLGALTGAKSSSENSKFMDLVKRLQKDDSEKSGMAGANGTAGAASANGTTSGAAWVAGAASANGVGGAGASFVSSSQIAKSSRLNGDFVSGFDGAYSAESDKNAEPLGAAANQANPHVQQKKIDRTSELYEKSMELENYFVKQMLSQMRKTVMKSKESDFAQQTYEDMLYDEYSSMMTKNAGFGLADQIYLSLV